MLMSRRDWPLAEEVPASSDIRRGRVDCRFTMPSSRMLAVCFVDGQTSVGVKLHCVASTPRVRNDHWARRGRRLGWRAITAYPARGAGVCRFAKFRHRHHLDGDIGTSGDDSPDASGKIFYLLEAFSATECSMVYYKNCDFRHCLKARPINTH